MTKIRKKYSDEDKHNFKLFLFGITILQVYNYWIKATIIEVALSFHAAAVLFELDTEHPCGSNKTNVRELLPDVRKLEKSNTNPIFSSQTGTIQEWETQM